MNAIAILNNAATLDTVIDSLTEEYGAVKTEVVDLGDRYQVLAEVDGEERDEMSAFVRGVAWTCKRVVAEV